MRQARSDHLDATPELSPKPGKIRNRHRPTPRTRGFVHGRLSYAYRRPKPFTLSDIFGCPNPDPIRASIRIWMPQESQVESCEHQDDSNIHCQSSPEVVFEEREIYADNDGYHGHGVKHESYRSAHFSPCYNR